MSTPTAEAFIRRANLMVTGNVPALTEIAEELFEAGEGGGKGNYQDLENKPSINGIELNGNHTLAELGAQRQLIAGANVTIDPATGRISSTDTNTDTPTNITSTTLQPGGSGFNRTLNLTPQSIASLAKADTAYQKPATGIAANDLATTVRNSLTKADSAYQRPATGIPASALELGIQAAISDANVTKTAVEQILGSTTPDVFTATKIDSKLPLVGGTMIGNLNLAGKPTTDNMAASKEYVDGMIAAMTSNALVFIGFISSVAPTGNVREGALWLEVSSPLEVGEAPSTAFPWQVHSYTAGAWSVGTEVYTGDINHQWRDADNNETWYYAGDEWERLDFNGSAFDSNDFDTSTDAVKIKTGAITNEKIATNAAITWNKMATLNGAVTALLTRGADGKVSVSDVRIDRVVHTIGKAATVMEYSNFSEIVMELAYEAQTTFCSVPATLLSSLVDCPPELQGGFSGMQFIADPALSSYAILTIANGILGTITYSNTSNYVDWKYNRLGVVSSTGGNNNIVVFDEDGGLKSSKVRVTTLAQSMATFVFSSEITSMLDLFEVYPFAWTPYRTKIVLSINSINAITDWPINLPKELGIFEVLGSETTSDGHNIGTFISPTSMYLVVQDRVSGITTATNLGDSTKFIDLRGKDFGAELLLQLESDQVTKGLLYIDSTTTGVSPTRTIKGEALLSFEATSDGSKVVGMLSLYKDMDATIPSTFIGVWRFAGSNGALNWSKLDILGATDITIPFTGTTIAELVAMLPNGYYTLPVLLVSTLTDLPECLNTTYAFIEIKGTSTLKHIILTDSIASNTWMCRYVVATNTRTEYTKLLTSADISSTVNYSTAEQDTGRKWIDGRTVYIKTTAITIDSMSANIAVNIGRIADLCPAATVLLDVNLISNNGALVNNLLYTTIVPDLYALASINQGAFNGYITIEYTK